MTTEHTLPYPMETPLKNPDQQGISPDLAYMLFPGDPDLPEQDKDLQRIWREETALTGADKVIFIGYSLPDYDSFSSMFFGKHISGEVYNPSPVDQQKYKNLFGSRIVKEGGNSRCVRMPKISCTPRAIRSGSPRRSKNE